MREEDLKTVLSILTEQATAQAKMNGKLIDKLDMFSRTILMVLEVQNRMIEVIPEWVERAEKGNPLSDSEVEDINKYTEHLLKKVN
tara:strand:+ start:627 stop:884 length:258 start_codon:yes stop_codon:yes gene_type:complete